MTAGGFGTARITNGPQKLRRGLYVAALIQAHGQWASPGARRCQGSRRSSASRPEAALTAPLPGQADGYCGPWALRWPRVTEAVEGLAAAEATVIRGNA